MYYVLAYPINKILTHKKTIIVMQLVHAHYLTLNDFNKT